MQWNYYAAFKKGEDPVTCQNMDEHRGHYAKWNKPITKKTNTIWYHSYEIPKVVKIIEMQTRQMAATIWKRGREELMSHGPGSVLQDRKF